MNDWKRAAGRRSGVWQLLTVLWALIPVLTLGFGTAPMMIHAAVRTKEKTRRKRQALTPVPYLAATALVFAFDPDVSSAQSALFGTGMLVNIIGGCGHAFAIRHLMWDDRTPRQRRLQERQRAVLDAMQDAAAARETARAIAASDPAQAIELRIGRADLQDREFPDGGLVDVNHVPSRVIAQALRVSVTKAAEVVRARETAGGFSSADELSVTMDLPPRHLDAVADRLVFLPRVPR